METTYKTLAQFLASLNLTVQQLKKRTGIPIYRLRAIYKDGQFTEEEFKRLVEALGARPAISMAYASQMGNFNQNGIGNEQNITINTFVTIIMRRLGLIPKAAPTRVLPAQPVLTCTAQQRVLSQLPGSQVAPVSGGLSPIDHVF
jgi:hypothetical protein